MSATNRGTVRVEHDAYPTPSWCVRRLLERVPLSGGTWLEPCAGEGAIIKAVQAVRKDVSFIAREIRRECWPVLNTLPKTAVRIGDFLACQATMNTLPLAITNPPYSLAQEVIEHSLRHAFTVAMLLRVNFLGSVKRVDWLQGHIPDIYVLPNRPPFGLNKQGKIGTDATEYAWFIWRRQARARRFGQVHILSETSQVELAQGRQELQAWLDARWLAA